MLATSKHLEWLVRKPEVSLLTVAKRIVNLAIIKRHTKDSLPSSTISSTLAFQNFNAELTKPTACSKDAMDTKARLAILDNHDLPAVPAAK
jgi:hypothetical protein